MAGSTAGCGWMFVWILSALLVNFANSIEYMARECGEVIDMDEGGGTLDSQLGSLYDNDLDCTVTLRTSLGRRILLTFERFDTEGMSPCSVDYLELFDNDLSSIRKLCGTSVPGDITSLYHEIILRFRTDSSISTAGFFLAYSSFSSGICGSGEFTCDNGRCIDDDLENNGYDNCGDNSDEIYDFDIDNTIYTTSSILQWGIGVIIAVIIGVIVAGVLICVCIGCLSYHICCKSSPPQQSNAVVLTSAGQQPTGQVVYTQPPPAYNQSAPYGQPAAPYVQPAAPYGPPAAPYGQPAVEQPAPSEVKA